MKLILLAALVAAIVPVSQCSGDSLSQDLEQRYLRDWLEGGYVKSLDRSMLMDPGIAGMVRWLDAPVPSFPWYSSDNTFYKRMAPASTFLPFAEYYAMADEPLEGEIISRPVRFNISQWVPFYVYYGSGQGLPFSQYLSLEPSRGNDLWIRGAENWTQYIVSPLGMTVELVADVPGGGMGGVYQTVQTENASLRSGTYQFFDGYNAMKFKPDRIGRHMLYLVVNNQPSNVVVIDVFAQEPPPGTPVVQPATPPSTSHMPGSAVVQPLPSASVMPPAADSAGDTPVTIIYPGPGNFQVYVDGVDVGVGSSGSFNTRVRGGTTHVISIWDGFWMYQKSIYFESGLPKTINVEAV